MPCLLLGEIIGAHGSMATTGTKVSRYRVHREDRIWWLVVIVCLIFIIDSYIHWEIAPTPLAKWSQKTVRDPLILALQYDRINKTCADHLCTSTEQFQSHIETLNSLGFEAISLKHLADFYYEGILLPEKSVLLTFDHAYLSTYESVHPIIKALQWPAVMEINADRIELRNTTFLYWGKLKQMAQSGLWDFTISGFSHSQGNNSYPAEPPSQENSTIRASLASQQTLLDGAIARIDANVTDTSSRISDHRIFSFSRTKDSLIGIPLKQALAERFNRSPELNRYVAFADDLFGLNTSLNKASQINQLRVPPGMSTENFSKLIESSIISPTIYGNNSSTQRLWKISQGQIDINGKVCSLQGSPQADMWLPSGPHANNWRLSTILRLDSGQFWFVQKSPTTDTLVRFGGDKQSLHVQVSNESGEITNLRSAPFGATKGERHSLTIIKRGHGMWVEWNGKLLFDRPIKLPSHFQGEIGVVSWTDSTDKSRVELADTKFEVLPNTLRVLEPFPSAEEVKKTHIMSDMLTHLSTIQWAVAGNKSWRIGAEDIFYKIAPDYFGLDFVPAICIMPQLPDKQTEGKIHITAEGWQESALRIIEKIKSPIVYLVFDELKAFKLSEVNKLAARAKELNPQKIIWTSHATTTASAPGLKVSSSDNICAFLSKSSKALLPMEET